VANPSIIYISPCEGAAAVNDWVREWEAGS